jgi:hypothetical protein
MSGRRLTRGAVCGALGAMALLVAPAVSLAGNAVTLSVSSDPVAGLPVQYTVGATTSAPDDSGYMLWVLILPASEGPCGSDEYLDPSQHDTEGLVLGGQQVQLGAGQSLSRSWTIPANLRGKGVDTTTSPPGPYLACAWIDDESTFAPVATASVPFTLRAPRESMRVNAPRCQATPEAESNYIEEHTDLNIQAVPLISKEVPQGAFSVRRTVTFGRGWIPAKHVVCAWTGPTGSDADPNADVYLFASATVTPSP